LEKHTAELQSSLQRGQLFGFTGGKKPPIFADNAQKMNWGKLALTKDLFGQCFAISNVITDAIRRPKRTQIWD